MAIARDSGVPSPLLASATGTVQTVTADPFTPTSSNPLVVVAIAAENFNPTNFVSLTVSWSGGTPTGASAWTKQIESVNGPTNSQFCQVWTATGPNSGVAGTVTATTGASSTLGSIAMMVDVLTGALGAGASNQSNSTSSGQNSIAVAGVRLGSWVYVANCNETTSLPWYAGTTVGVEAIEGSPSRSAVGVNQRGTESGSVTVGWIGATTFHGEAALEITQAYDAASSETARSSDSFAGFLEGSPVTWFQGDALASDAYAILGGSAGGGGGSFSHTQQDNAQASDQFGLLLNPVWGVGAVEAAVANDQLAIAILRNVAQTDTALASDSEAYGIGLRYSQTDNAQANDQLDIALTKNVLQTDTARANDQLDVALTKNVSQTDNAQASDSLEISLLKNVGQIDTALASDAFDVVVVAAGIIVDSFSDAVLAGDDQALAIVKNVAQSDSAVALDTWAFSLASPAGPLTAEQSDSAVASDAFAASGGSTITELSIIHLWDGAAWVRWNGSAWV